MSDGAVGVEGPSELMRVKGFLQEVNELRRAFYDDVRRDGLFTVG
jgi:hypothetical protein